VKVIREVCSTIQKETIGLTEKLVKKYQHSLRNNTEELASNLHSAGQLKIPNLTRFIINIGPIRHSSFQVEVAVSGRSFVQKNPTVCNVLECDRGTSHRRLMPTRVVEP
jgi:hypothetical protein